MEVHVYELWCCGFTYYIKIKAYCYFKKNTVIPSLPLFSLPPMLYIFFPLKETLSD